MRLRILGVCGTFMAGLAQLAREMGHEVTGNDAHVYPPMSDFLRATGIRLHEGWDPASLDDNPDLVIIGNALSRGNPLVEAVLDRGLPYTSGAQWVGEQVLRGREVVAVAGTHGKTTTTALIAWLLDGAGLETGYLVGGIPQDFPAPARLGRGPFVIEADEYDTAFFDKRSKFVHYRPTVALLNNLEFDHADIFPDLEAISRQFHHLLRTVPASGKVVWNSDDEHLGEVLERGCWSHRVPFGCGTGMWRAVAGERGAHAVTGPSGIAFKLGPALPGRHNAMNAAGALAAVSALGVEAETVAARLLDFRGVKRRLELRGVVDGVELYDDFAHHPTAIAATIESLRARVPASGRLLAVVELRSNSMRSGAHREHLAESLAGADRCLILRPNDPGWDLAATLAPLGERCQQFADTAGIVASLAGSARTGDHILVMSNGGFEQLHDRVLAALAARPR